MNYFDETKPTKVLGKVLESFMNPSEDQIKEYHLVKNEYNPEIYPLEYCGAFYHNDSGRLSLFVTDETTCQKFLDLLDLSRIDIKQATYPLYVLLNNLKRIANLGPDFYNSVYVLQRDNKIHIECSSDEIEDKIRTAVLKMGIDKEMIIYDPHSKPASAMVAVRSGKPVLRNNTTGGGTVCCNCYRPQAQDWGVLTCGHVIYTASPVTQYVKDSAGNKIGDSFSSRIIGGMVDCVFIPFTGQVQWAATYYYQNHLLATQEGTIYQTSSTAFLFEGDTLIKYGKATGRKAGDIISTSMTCTVSAPSGVGVGPTYTLNDLIKSNNDISGGDSGGPIGEETIGYNNHRYFSLVGMVTAGIDGSYTLSCKITNITSALGISILTGPVL